MQKSKVAFFIIFFCLPTSYFLLFTSPINASGEFQSSYNVIYNVQEDGNTTVDQEITLRNKLTHLFATESEITLGSANIYNISAHDSVGKIYIRVSKLNEETKVRAIFNDKVVGEGKIYVWHLRYETPDLVSLNGLIKEINVPKLELNPDIDQYNLSIQVPKSFGPIIYTKPINKNELFFDKADLIKGQVSVAFGKFQVFNYKLDYYLKNSKIKPIISEIALPPDTSYQNIYLKSLNPPPLNVELDPDGNWLAKYQILPEQNLHITATGSAQIFLNPQKKEEEGNFNSLKSWVAPQNYWESDEEQIKKIALQLKNPLDIYNFVVAKLQYDYDRVAKNPIRLGAKYALQNPNMAICTEFTDLFISLARAAGIGAREVDGFAFTNNNKLKPLGLKKDILHAWPEYYDPGRKNWIQIDPTWADTTGGVDFFNTFDLNHFAFVTKGRVSEYPLPAGAYKNGNKDSKDIEVVFGDESDLVNRKEIELNLVAPNVTYSGFNYQATLSIRNKGFRSLEKQSLTLKTIGGALLSPATVDINSIPPFGKTEIKIDFRANPNLSPTNLTLQAFYGGFFAQKNISVKPLTIIYLIPIFILVVIAAGTALVLARKKWKP